MISSKNSFISSVVACLVMVALPLIASADDDHNGSGAVYTMNNAADANRIVVYTRSSGGDLKLASRESFLRTESMAE